ncbi:Cupin [Pararobbsia alpina]|jgi:mannose-6-phosphate isomerase-like protein (cupin superfamily)|uniref:cupin domain-containing protein n=1 Tax=Pararobbsia alpina TaxID=621374 RepID=UPI0039A773E4
MMLPIDTVAFARGVHNGYRNEVLTTVNDHNVHISVMDEPFRWHFHPNTDETFLTLEGTLVIDFAEGPVHLHAGQMLTVRAGTRHRTRPGGARSVNLTVEREDSETVFCDGPV